MKFAAISAPQYDPASPLILTRLDSSSSGITLSRRNSVTATLDGSAVLEDGGYSDGDRPVTLSIASLTAAQHTELRRLITSYSVVVLGMSDGVYIAAFSSYDVRRGEATVFLRIVSKLSA